MAMQSGTFVNCFKHSHIIPLLKSSSLDRKNLNNYRLIATLPFLSKVFERLVQKQLLAHINTLPILDQFQSGFRANHSTETALTKIYNDISLELDQNHSVILILLDLSAAFDTINHDTLIKILNKHVGLNDFSLS
jgi:hypothetical protein